MRTAYQFFSAVSLLVLLAQGSPPVVRAQDGAPGGRARVAAAGAMQERVLATLPPGLAVKAKSLPYALMFTPDGRQVAYVARYRVGDLMAEAVVVGDRRGPEATFLAQVALSADGSRVAYLASFRENIEAAYLFVGNRRDQVQIKQGSTDPTWVPVFSPDGRRLAYKAETPGGKRVIRVADVSAIPPETHTDDRHTQLASESGPEFDDVDEPRFSADGAHLAYAARDGRGWTIVVDGAPGPIYRDAASPVFRADGRIVAYRATRDERQYFVVVGDQEGPRFDAVSRMAFSPDGSRVAYGAQEQGKYWIVVGEEKRPVAHLADQVVFSADGQRVAYWTRESRGRGRERLIVDDRPGPEFDHVGWPVFDESVTVAAYWARDKEKYVMVAGRRRSERFDGVGRTRVFDADGGAMAFGVLQGGELRWTVMKTR